MPWTATLAYTGPQSATISPNGLHFLACRLLDDKQELDTDEFPHHGPTRKRWSAHVEHPTRGTVTVHLTLFDDRLLERLRPRILENLRPSIHAVPWVLDPDQSTPPVEHPWLGLAAGDPTIGAWTLTFTRPGAAFVSAGQCNVDFGTQRVLNQLADTWREFHPASCPARDVADLPSLRVSRIDGSTGPRMRVGKGVVTPWRGTYTYQTNRHEAKPERNGVVDALFRFAELNGIGSRLTYGLGAVTVHRSAS